MRVLRYIGGGLCAALLLWIALSWADIVADNNYPNPQHCDVLIFYPVICTKIAGYFCALSHIDFSPGRQRAPRPEFLFVRQFQQLYGQKFVQSAENFSPEIA